jgi:hypothetical protein
MTTTPATDVFTQLARHLGELVKLTEKPSKPPVVCAPEQKKQEACVSKSQSKMMTSNTAHSPPVLVTTSPDRW